jgi:hypothetical protein
MIEKTAEEILKLLSDPFPENDIEWRVQQSGMAANPWAMVIPYVTNRAIIQRFNDVFGIMGWEDTYRETPRGMLCGITVHFNGRSVTKWDGAETPKELTAEEIKKGKKQTIDPIKTVLSNSEKRAAVKFSVGLYLYSLETAFATCQIIGKRRDVSDSGTYMKIKQQGQDLHAEWFPPPLEAWALPSVEFDSLLEKVKSAKSMIVMQGAYITAYKYASSFGRGDQIKEAVKAKDEQKLKLETESKQENTQAEQDLRVWLERACNDQIFGAQNESVLKLNKQRLAKELGEKCLEAGVDVMDLLQVLENHYQNHLNKLKP